MTNPRRVERWRLVGTAVLAMGLSAHALSRTALFDLTSRAIAREGTYEEQRAAHGFIVPIEALARALDETLGPDVPVSLTMRLRGEALYAQRLAEGLYPRRIDADASHRVGLARAATAQPAGSTDLSHEPAGTWFVAGPTLPAPPVSAPAAPAGPRWATLLFGLVVVVGLGAPVALAVLVRRDGWLLPTAGLAGGFVLGLLFSVATWWGTPLGRGTLTALAGAGLAVATFRLRHQGLSRRCPLPAVELAVWLGLVGLLFFHQLRLPITGWDGRSIWLFHAKQLGWHGFIPLAELTSPSYAFSHPEYPLLFPAWLAAHGGAPPFDERTAALSIPVLFSILLLLVWSLLVPRLGRVGAAAVAVAAVLGLHRNVFLGYADGHLALMLLIQVVALSRPDTAGLGLLAGAAAGLMKAEGFVFSATVFLVSLVAQPQQRSRWRSVLLASLPAAVHVAWSRSLGLTGDYPRLAWDLLAADPIGRLAAVATAMGEAVRSSALVQEGGALGAVALLAAFAGVRPLSDRLFGTVILLSVVWSGTAVAILLLSPRDLAWHAGRSVDRLLLHPALLLVIAPFLATAPKADTAPDALL